MLFWKASVMLRICIYLVLRHTHEHSILSSKLHSSCVFPSVLRIGILWTDVWVLWVRIRSKLVMHRSTVVRGGLHTFNLNSEACTLVPWSRPRTRVALRPLVVCSFTLKFNFDNHCHSCMSLGWLLKHQIIHVFFMVPMMQGSKIDKFLLSATRMMWS